MGIDFFSSWKKGGEMAFSVIVGNYGVCSVVKHFVSVCTNSLQVLAERQFQQLEQSYARDLFPVQYT